LGSATPALETLHNAYVGRYHHLKIPIRAGLSSPPILEILDIRHKKLQEGLSYALIGQLEKHLNAGEQVLLFLNRRGFAPVLFCPECQWAAECKRCDARLTYHQASPQLRCHHCEAAYPLETMCPKCQNPDLIPLGMGTERIETFLKKKFPHKRVLRLDRDTSPSAKKVTLALDAIHKGEADILLGTQMIAKGHHFPRVTLVAILDIDAAFFSHDFRSLERIGQLIVQVAGRAGRAEKLGQVLLQTAQPEHPLLQTLLSQGYGAFAKALLTERHIAHLPPYSFHALLRCEARTLDSALNFLKKAKAKIHHFGSLNLKALGPVPSPMERCRNRYRAQLLLQASKRSQLNLLLKNIMPHLESQPRAQQLRWSLDIDPLDMF
jgi:primosomal protein N' (replication factor Y)